MRVIDTKEIEISGDVTVYVNGEKLVRPSVEIENKTDSDGKTSMFISIYDAKY
jgi:hypothetical protein